jgi:hypothetical protein
MLSITFAIMFGSLGFLSLLHMFLIPGSANVEEHFEEITEGTEEQSLGSS